VEFQEQVNMIIYNFQSMDFVAFLCANIVEDGDEVVHALVTLALEYV